MYTERNARLLACDEGMPGSDLRALGGLCSLIMYFKALQMNDETMEPSTHQAACMSCRTANTANTKPATAHFVSSLTTERKPGRAAAGIAASGASRIPSPVALLSGCMTDFDGGDGVEFVMLSPGVLLSALAGLFVDA